MLRASLVLCVFVTIAVSVSVKGHVHLPALLQSSRARVTLTSVGQPRVARKQAYISGDGDFEVFQVDPGSYRVEFQMLDYFVYGERILEVVDGIDENIDIPSDQVSNKLYTERRNLPFTQSGPWAILFNNPLYMLLALGVLGLVALPHVLAKVDPHFAENVAASKKIK